MANPPTGTVTFLFTDIEGSTRLAQAHPAAWEAARQRHHALVQAAIEAHQGYVFQLIGDAFCVAFETAPNALAAALEAQRALQAEAWGDTPVKVRMGLHTGAAEAHDGDYRAYLTLVQVQRVMAMAFGGQTLVSNATAGLLSGQLPEGISLRDLGEHRLKGLLNPEHLWQVMAPDLPQDFPPLVSLTAITNNLPVQLTSFIGRGREIAEVTRLLATTRLLTLTGVGGTGKTRLSLQVAASLLDRYTHGVWLVELAPLADPALVPQTVASALAVREQPGQPLMTTLLDYLREKQLLLILDNCEHLLDACAHLADALLHAAPGLRILASSREALGIAGETVYQVPSLPLPDPNDDLSAAVLAQNESVRLFAERAAAAKAGFGLTAANAAAVAQICYRLDGIPLAIELAAARVKAFSVEQIAARLDDRFRLLTGGSRTALPRQQTLRALIDWSYGLLSDAERVVFRRLSVFAGGWTLEAAEAVCAGESIQSIDVADLLARLVDKSLVLLDERDAEPRYRMLETIRQYGSEKLLDSGDGDQTRVRHLRYYVRLATLFAAAYIGARQIAWLMRLEAENDNLRAALAWSVATRDAASGMRMAGAVDRFWFQRFPLEGLEHLRAILALPEAGGRTAERASALNAAGYLQTFSGDYAGAKTSLEEALAIGRELRDDRLTTASLLWLGQLAYALKDLARGRVLFTEALESTRRSGDQYRTGTALWMLGDVVMSQGAVAEAQRLFEESVTVLRPIGENLNLAVPLRRLGQIDIQSGRHEPARKLILESLELNIGVGDRRGVAACLTALASLRMALGHLLRAAQLLGCVEALLDSLHTQMLPLDQSRYEETLARVQADLDAATFAAAWGEGSKLTLEQAIAYALNDLASG